MLRGRLRLHTAPERLPQVHLLSGGHEQGLQLPGRSALEAERRELRLALGLGLYELNHLRVF